MTQYDLNLRDYWRILRKRKWSVGLVALAFGVTAYVFAEVQKPDPIYEATAVAKWERMTTLVGLLTESLEISGGDNLATQSAVVRSFPVLERAAKALGMIPAELDPEAIKQNPQYIQLISNLRGQVSAAPEENTTLINITVTSRDPAQAARIANAVAQAYREENRLRRSRQIREARRFIEEQLTEVGGRLQEVENEIRALKEARGFISLTEETTALLARLNALETEYERVRRTQQETTNQIQALQDPRLASGAVSPRIFTDAGDPTIAKLNSSLLDLGVERENLLVTFTPRHPQVRDLDARIATTRENLVRELRLKVQTFQGRAADLQRQIQQIRQDQRSLPDVARQFTQLQRDMTINENLLTQLRSKLQEVKIKEKEQVEEVLLVRPALEPTKPNNPPQSGGKAAVGLLIGLTIGLVMAFVLESMDTSIGTIQDVESYLEVPVLGLIPNIDPTKDPSLAPPEDEGEDGALGTIRAFLISLLNPKSTIAEAYRSLRTNVEFLSLEKNVKTLCVTSATLMEGKTTTAINLAITMAQLGKKILLVETDLRRPFVHHAFGIPRDPGIAEVILGNKDWKECVRSASDLMLGPLGLERVMAAPNIDKLHILTSGTPPPNPSEFLTSQRMTDLIAAFRQQFDMVIFDCSPVLPVTDAAILASKADGMLIVYRVGQTPRSALKRSKTLLENVRGKVLGIVLTGLRAEVSPDYEELEYYRYAYGHEPRGRTSARLGTLVREPILTRIANSFRKVPTSAKSWVLFPVGILIGLAGSWAWWSGHGPAEPVKRLSPEVEKVRAAAPASLPAPPPGAVLAPTPLTGEPSLADRVRSLTPGAEKAYAATAGATPATSPAATVPSPPSDRASTSTPKSEQTSPPSRTTESITPLSVSDTLSMSPSATTKESVPSLGGMRTAASGQRQASPPVVAASPSPPARGAFSLQVASAPDQVWSQAHAEALRKRDLQAFTVPADIPGKGRWYRVLIGAFDSLSSATQAGQDLRAQGRIDGSWVQSLPYAVEVVGLATPDQAAKATKTARRFGYLPVLREEDGDPSAGAVHILRVWAFRTLQEAERLANLLRVEGLTPRVIRR